MKKEKLKILHISDIHWGSDLIKTNPDDAHRARKEILETKLLDFLRENSDSEESIFDFVIVTGDIAFSGDEKEYSETYSFFEEVKTVLKFNNFQKFIFCPGNHDFNRGSIEKKEDSLFKEVDQYFEEKPKNIHQKLSDLLNVDNLHDLSFPFQDFSYFLKEKLKIIRPKNDYSYSKVKKDRELHNLKETYDYLNGYIDEFENEYGIRFQVLNSAWFSLNDKDSGNLFLGDSLISDNFFNSSDNVLNVGLIHHPFEFLAYPEYNIIPGTKNATYIRLLDKCDLILSGHIHTSSSRLIYYPKYECSVLVGGATYEKKNYYNAFNIIDLDLKQNTISYKPIIYALKGSRTEWIVDIDNNRGVFSLKNSDTLKRISEEAKFWENERTIYESKKCNSGIGKEITDEEVSKFIVKNFVDTFKLSPHFQKSIKENFIIYKDEKQSQIYIPFNITFFDNYLREFKDTLDLILEDGENLKVFLLPHLYYARRDTFHYKRHIKDIFNTLKDTYLENNNIFVHSLSLYTFSEICKKKHLFLARKEIEIDEFDF